MRLRLGAVVAGLVCLLATPAFAQNGVQGGIIGGLNVADITFDDLDEEVDVSFSPVTRFAIGAFVEIPVSEMFSIQPEFLYSVKGVRFTDDFFDESFALRLNYIEIPILFRTNFQTGRGARPFVVAGPVFGIKAGSAKIGGYDGDFGDEFDEFADEFAEELDENISSTDVGITLGGGVHIGRLIVEARYQFGLKDINTVSGTGAVAKTRSFLVLVGVGFGS